MMFKRINGEGCRCGRPSAVTDEVLGKLWEAFSNALTDEEACLYAGIHRDTLYAYQEKNPTFSDRKRQLRLTPIIAAKHSVIRRIPGNPAVAQWWLNKRASKEFGDVSKVELEVDGRIETTDGTIIGVAKALGKKFDDEFRRAIVDSRKSENKPETPK